MIGYPTKINPTTPMNTDKTKSVSHVGRGMSLEKDINETNNYYDLKNIAIIYKKPTPIKVVNVEYPKAKIKEAYFTVPSTTDYNGIYKGKYIDFEAKETKSLTSFPLNNIHKHQRYLCRHNYKMLNLNKYHL